jgi:hypothetical protein
MSSASGADPTPLFRTVYDETYQLKSFENPIIISLANRIPAHLKRHTPNTDGSFHISLAEGVGTFVGKVGTLILEMMY